MSSYNCQGDLQRKGCLDGQIKDMMKNTRESWKEIGNDGKKDDLRKEEQQKQLGKKKKLSKTNQR